MTEIPIVVSDDVVTVGGYTDKVELQLSVGATGERGSRIFTGSVNPNTLPSNDPIWGGYTDFKRGDIYLLRDTDLLEVWEYLWSGGEYVWVQTVDNIAGGGGSVTLDPDLDAIAALTGTGILKRTAPNTWALDTTSYLTANQTITLSGDASGSGTTSIVVTVADDSHSHTGSTISGLDAGDTTTGTFDIARIPTGTTGTTVALGNHTHSYQPLDADLTAIAALAGTSGFLKKTATDTWTLDTNTYLTGNQSISVSGDATGSGTTSIALTLANSGVAAGTYNNNAAQVRPFTVDAKGRVTSIGAAVNIAIPQSAVTNLTTDLSGKSPLAGSSSIQTVGTIYTGNWNAGPVTSRYFYQWANGEPTSNLGSPTVSEMALFDSQFNNKLWFYDPTKFTFTYTMNGTDWITQSNSTSEIKNLVGGAGATGSNISIPNLAQKYRIDIRNDGTYVYTNALYMYFSTNSHQTKVHIWKKRDDGSWTQVTSSNTNVSSWPGHLYLPFDTIPWSTSLTGGHYNDIRIEFTPTWTTGGSYDYTNISLINLEIWGGYPAGRRTIYNWDSDKNVTFPAALTATTTISGSGLAGSLLSSTNPLMDGAAAAGTSAIPSRQDHVHPVDTSRSPVAGSSSITTVGTIGSGTWQGSVVAGQYGGTGVANTGKTITVSGNTTIGSSTHTVAFATSGNTSVTLPTSGTLEVTGHTHAYQPIDADLTAIAAVSGTGYLRRTGVDTWTLDTPATATWGGITGTLSSQTDLQNALNAKQAADNDLTAIAALAGTSGFLKKTATDTWTLDTANYLPTSGGTVSGEISFSDDGEGISFYGSARIYKRIGSGITIKRHSSDVDPMVENAAGNAWYKIWHEGNDGASSGLDADTLDGSHASAFALSGHNHSGTYQPLDGDLTAIAALSGTGFLRRTGTDTWTLAAAGTGDVVGPASATDNAIAVYDGTTGKLIKNSNVNVGNYSLSSTSDLVVGAGSTLYLESNYSISTNNNVEIWTDLSTDWFLRGVYAESTKWEIDQYGSFNTNGGVMIGGYSSGTKIVTNNGNPEGSVTASIGSIVLDDSYGRIYVKETGGSTGWARLAKEYNVDDNVEELWANAHGSQSMAIMGYY